MSRDKVQGFLLGLGAGVLVACFLKPPGEFDNAPPERLREVPPRKDMEGVSEAAMA
jgi:hypothetical protein